MNKDDFLKFFDACDPTRTLMMNDDNERQYYIDFSEVRGGDILVEELENRIVRQKNKPTCQLFTGHIGSGKSTELRNLQNRLEKGDFYVVYFEPTKDLDLTDINVTDLLFAIAHQIGENLEEIGITLETGFFKKIFEEIKDIVKVEITEFQVSLPLVLGSITGKIKQSHDVRSRLRQRLAGYTTQVLEAINDDVIKIAIEKLKGKGKKGLVVIVDGLDRIGSTSTSSEHKQAEDLFISKAPQLRDLKCHLIYTVPLFLTLSHQATLTNHLGGGNTPKKLPMVQVNWRNHQPFDKGMNLLRKMIMVRAFPEFSKFEGEKQDKLVTDIFGTTDNLDRLCQMSGGHIRTLLGMLSRSLERQEPPLSKDCLEKVFRDYRDTISLNVKRNQWELLKQIEKEQDISGEPEYVSLLSSLFVFEYKDEEGSWFDVNPVLKETKKFQSL
ncbi:MAG: AAA family ATPase [Crocosphaera sp.]|nr:AAA family ATPase [Crocosphaera sp.]